MENDKCPCKECICFAICHNSKRIDKLIDKCYIINDYISSVDKALITIKTIEPLWYVKDEGSSTVSAIAENLLRYSWHNIELRRRDERV